MKTLARATDTTPSQAIRLFKLLRKHKKGLSSVEIQNKLGTTCPHKRFSELLYGGYPVEKVNEQRGSCVKVYRVKKEAFYGQS